MSGDRYIQGANPPGLRSPDWKPLKTWHIALGPTSARCGANLIGPAKDNPPEGARICRACRERYAPANVKEFA